MNSYEKKQLIYKFTLVLVVVSCIVAVTSSSITYYVFGASKKISKSEASENSLDNITSISSTLKSFRRLIDQYYIGDIDEGKILDETIKGYVNGLNDEYSEYMTKEEWEEYQLEALGNYVGIGIYMSLDKNGYVVIVAPIDGTPASEAGLKSEDIIVEVDGENVIGLSTNEVSSKIKGEQGTTVDIKILRDNEYMDFKIIRKEIKVYHVEYKMLEDNIGYIQLLTFDDGCSEEFNKAYQELVTQGAKKLIFDLRYNTGGLVDEALEIADMIIPKGKTLLITVDSNDNKEITEAKTDNIINMDMVVLVNEYSASASEILAGALKDNKAATLVGTKTYGKGVIQNVFSLNDGSVLKLTVSEYFTPNETKINKQGIEPDYVMEVKEDTPKEEDTQLNKAIELLK